MTLYLHERQAAISGEETFSYKVEQAYEKGRSDRAIGKRLSKFITSELKNFLKEQNIKREDVSDDKVKDLCDGVCSFLSDPLKATLRLSKLADSDSVKSFLVSPLPILSQLYRVGWLKSQGLLGRKMVPDFIDRENDYKNGLREVFVNVLGERAREASPAPLAGAGVPRERSSSSAEIEPTSATPLLSGQFRDQTHR